MATSLTAVGFVWATLSLAAALLCCSGFYLPFWIQSKIYQCSSLWAKYSMIKKMLLIKKNVDINKYCKLVSFLKSKSSGHEPKKAKVLSKENVIKFMTEAPDDMYLLTKGRLLGKVDAYFSSFRRCNYPRVSPQGAVEIVEECGRYSRFWDIPSPWWQASTVLVGIGSALSLLIAVTAAAACCITYVVHAGTARIAGVLQLISALLVIAGAAIYPVGWDNREVRESCGNTSHIYKLGTCQLSWSVYLLASAVLLLLLCFCLSFCASRVNAGSFRI